MAGRHHKAPERKPVLEAFTEQGQRPEQLVKDAMEQISTHGPNYELGLKGNLAERFIPLSWTGISARILHGWKSEWLFDQPPPPEDRERERTRLTVAEFISLDVVRSLRLFGLPLSALRVVHNVLRRETDEEDAQELMERNRIAALEKLPAGSYSEEQLRDSVQRTMQMGSRDAVALNWLLSILAAKVRVDLIVFYDGSCTVATDGIVSGPDWVATEPRITVPINEIVYRLALLLEEQTRPQPVSLLSENEAEIIALVRSGKTSSILITLVNGAPTRLEFTEQKQVSSDQLVSLVRQLKKDEYQSIEIKTNGGKTVHYQQTRKQKLSASRNVRR